MHYRVHIRISQFLLLISAIQCFIVQAQQQLCSIPSDDELKLLFLTIGSDDLPAGLSGGELYFTCKAAPSNSSQPAGQNTSYSELSVIYSAFTYNGTVIAIVRQFELDCNSTDNTWNARVGSVTEVPDSFNYTQNITASNCSSCSKNAGNDFHCLKDCGLSSCPDAGYTVNSVNCTCTLTDICVADNPCNNNGVCILDTARPDQYTCNCTGTGYTGTNCTELCTLTSCPRGYVVNVDNCMCVLDDICVADNPCSNNGVCILDTIPDQYTCNCTGTGYTGTNCRECSLTCPMGYVVNADCMCVQLDSDICVADNPCSNGGTCVSGSSPNQYSCQCIDKYTGTNCTECVAGYTGRNCSECDVGYRVNNTEGSCTIMDRDNIRFSSGTERAISSIWHVGLPVFLLVVYLYFNE